MKRDRLSWTLVVLAAVGLAFCGGRGFGLARGFALGLAMPRPLASRPAPVVVQITSCRPLVVVWAWADEVRGQSAKALECPSPEDVKLAQWNARVEAGVEAAREVKRLEAESYWRGANEWYGLGREDWR